MKRSNQVGDLIRLGWGFYGYPGSPTSAVGEVGYVVDWRADQMTRLEWDVTIDGSDNWTVPASDLNPDAISTTVEGEQDLTSASTALLDLIGWDDTNIRAIDTNLFVAGKFDYANLSDGWRVVSTIEPDRKKTLETAGSDVVPFILAHPANPKVPNPPLARILDLLESLEWLTRQSSTQSKQRVLMNGILVTADSLEGPPLGDGTKTTFWDEWNATISAKQNNPDDMSPVRLQAPTKNVQEGSVNWILPPFGYDDVLDKKITAAIKRLGWGLPVPPEILLGMQAQSRATAFQVEENAYRAHIEPPAKLVAQVAEDALNLILPDVTVKVVPNPTQMLARKQSVEDIKWAWESGLVTPTYTREVLGIPEDEAPDEAIDGIPVKAPAPIASDPANVAADEPVAASASGPNLSDLLADIDAHLASELAGYTASATERARQRLGAAARVNPKMRENGVKDLSNSQLAVHLGYDGLTAAGVNVTDQITEPIGTACEWWMRRLKEAWGQAAALVPGWTGQGAWAEESVLVLSDALTEHVATTLGEPLPPPLDGGRIRDVIDAAAGDTAQVA